MDLGEALSSIPVCGVLSFVFLPPLCATKRPPASCREAAACANTPAQAFARGQTNCQERRNNCVNDHETLLQGLRCRNTTHNRSRAPPSSGDRWRRALATPGAQHTPRRTRRAARSAANSLLAPICSKPSPPHNSLVHRAFIHYSATHPLPHTTESCLYSPDAPPACLVLRV